MAAGAFPGRHFDLDEPELGAKWIVIVLRIGQCPKIETGEGHVAISTFSHPASHKVLDVTFGDIPSTMSSSSSLQPSA